MEAAGEFTTKAPRKKKVGFATSTPKGWTDYSPTL
jgi:hypothetical protein